MGVRLLPLAARRLSTMTRQLSPPAKAVLYDDHGPPDKVLRVAEVAPVEIGERDVCVRMLAAPINPSDLNRIEGVYPIRPPLPAAVAGYEGLAQVHALGSGDVDLSPGDWVIPSPPSFGTWQTYIVKPATAWHKNGATSIVGQCVIQLAKLHAIHTINIIRDRPGSQQAKDKLIQLGADQVFTESQLNIKNIKSLLGALPEPALGLNCVGGSAASAVLKFLRQGGTMVTYGGMSKKPVTVSTSSFIFKDLSLRGFWLQKWMNSDKAEESRTMIDYLLDLVHEGKLKYEMELTPFSEFHLALDKALGKHGSRPKQVLKF
uniref:enoyl-[acyl-carrier-protein] reductase n=1 Tax=Leersia perrieri TaxID=77586 RepID=A0A0D9XVY8_9ORYZ